MTPNPPVRSSHFVDRPANSRRASSRSRRRGFRFELFRSNALTVNRHLRHGAWLPASAIDPSEVSGHLLPRAQTQSRPIEIHQAIAVKAPHRPAAGVERALSSIQSPKRRCEPAGHFGSLACRRPAADRSLRRRQWSITRSIRSSTTWRPCVGRDVVIGLVVPPVVAELAWRTRD
jgi:hypothetical protein